MLHFILVSAAAAPLQPAFPMLTVRVLVFFIGIDSRWTRPAVMSGSSIL